VRDGIITEIWNGRGRAEVAEDAICVASQPLSRPCHSLVTVAEECPLLSKLGSSGAGRVGAEYSLAVHCGVDHCRTYHHLLLGCGREDILLFSIFLAFLKAGCGHKAKDAC